jgi:uncharacterized membrane protein YozB (DUF420 family)
MDYTALPALNATLNGTAAVLLTVGLILIKQKKIDAHRLAMMAAFAVSIAFLCSYLVYHAHVGSVPYKGTGPLRSVYFAILITHVLLAFTVPVLASITLFRGLKMRVAQHRKIARWTLPIWLYVSVTGVVVYLMLYRM